MLLRTNEDEKDLNVLQALQKPIGYFHIVNFKFSAIFKIVSSFLCMGKVRGRLQCFSQSPFSFLLMNDFTIVVRVLESYIDFFM